MSQDDFREKSWVRACNVGGAHRGWNGLYHAVGNIRFGRFHQSLRIAKVWTDKITEKGGMRRGRAGQRGKTQEYQGIAGLDGGTMGGCSHLSCPGRASSASTLFFHAQTGRNRRGTGRADESAEIPGNHENQGFPGISAWYIWKDPMGAR